MVAESAEGGAQIFRTTWIICTLYKCTQAVTYDFNAWQELMVGLRYLLTRSGPGVSNVAEAGGFVRTGLGSG